MIDIARIADVWKNGGLHLFISRREIVSGPGLFKQRHGFFLAERKEEGDNAQALPRVHVCAPAWVATFSRGGHRDNGLVGCLRTSSRLPLDSTVHPLAGIPLNVPSAPP